MAKKAIRSSSKNRESPILVSICQTNTDDTKSLLAEVLGKSNFWEILESNRIPLELEKSAFKILIKPDLEFFELGAPTGTDPKLVEQFIDILFEKGYTNIVIGDGVGQADLWLENRDVVILADLVGYRFETPNGNPYDILDLSEDILEHPFDSASVLTGTGISSHWLEAGFRINFCKNKADEEHLFALGLHNLMNLLPLKAKDYHYRSRLKQEEVVTELIPVAKVDFTIIDAFVSNHGSQGIRHPNPLKTKTFIAGNNLLLVDWVGALKMGLDPYASKLNAAALRKIGLPKTYQIDGDLTTYYNWKSAAPLLKESVHLRNEILVVRKMSKPWLQKVDKELFPFKNVMDEQINDLLVPLLKDIDNHPLVYWVMIGLNYFLVNTFKIQESWQILYDKEKLYRQNVGLGIDAKNYQPKDFDAIEHYVRPLAQIVQYSKPDANGIKWRYIDNSVLFEFTKILPIPFDDFIVKVDISQAVQMMYDNIGGLTKPIKKDARKRTIYQMERDIYLPQPNWMVLFGGKYIDVEKIELLKYTNDKQEILWQTVNSPNNSADFDDGLITFEKVPSGTKITIIARQKFELPIFWQVVNIDYLPDLKNTLVSDAYLRFFTRTMANFEAAYEGRSTYLGKNYDAQYGESNSLSKPLEIEQLKNIFSLVAGFAKNWLQSNDKNTANNEVLVDENGYHHFTPTEKPQDAVRSFFKDLSKAVESDLKLLSKPSKN